MRARLCPGCATGYQDPATGLCDACHEERLRIRYAREDNRREEQRRAWWAERQHRHRKREKLRPAEPLPVATDPLRIAAEALDELAAVARASKSPGHAAACDHLGELIRQLGWGPE